MLSCFVQYLTRAICLFTVSKDQCNDELCMCPSLIDCSDVLCKAGNVYICCSVSNLFKDFPSWPTTRLQQALYPHTHIIDSQLSSFRKCQEHIIIMFSIILSQWSGAAGFVIKLTAVGPGLAKLSPRLQSHFSLSWSLGPCPDAQQQPAPVSRVWIVLMMV